MQTVTIHKEGAEGVIQVDALNGRIVTPNADRPEWSNGLVAALLQTRLSWYESRVGKDSQAFQNLKSAESIEISDLDWVTVTANGEEGERRADSETRMDNVATMLGVSREALDGEADFGTTQADREIVRAQDRKSTEEAQALEEATGSAFGQSAEQAAQRQVAGKGR